MVKFTTEKFIEKAIKKHGPDRYWHKIHEEKEPGYHENKQKACEENGVKLIEIWEND